MLTMTREAGQTSDRLSAAGFATIGSKAIAQVITAVEPGDVRARTDRWELPVRCA